MPSTRPTTRGHKLLADGFAQQVTSIPDRSGLTTLNADGTSTATFTGADLDTGVLAADGTSTATFTGADLDTGVLAAAGTSTATFTGAALDTGVLAAAGTSTATFASSFITTVQGVLSANGTSTVTFTGSSITTVQGVLSADGTSTVTFTGVAVASGPSQVGFDVYKVTAVEDTVIEDDEPFTVLDKVLVHLDGETTPVA